MSLTETITTGRTATEISATPSRIHSIDFLRGIVMVLMALDHTRTFLHEDFYQFNAEDLSQTTPVLFFTRWVTHFCAPVFIFLVGTSAYLLHRRAGSKKQLSQFLITRGLLLIFLEITLFRLCWSPPSNFLQPRIMLLVIWAIGISMIFLAFLVYLPYRVILITGLMIVFFHNTLAPVTFPEGSSMATFWAFFYSGGPGSIGNINLFFLYPILPYFGLIALGYCLGSLYAPGYPFDQRKRWLLGLGTGTILLFIILRYFNIYGDPNPWEPGKDAVYSTMAFLKTTKYPVSLLYCMMTLGPALILLALVEPVKNRVISLFVTIGAVPMFYYILHLVFLAVLVRVVGFNAYNLFVVYVYFISLVIVLYLLCRKYAKYKSRHPEKKWLRYL
jgi:uncharacterized membrane protein